MVVSQQMEERLAVDGELCRRESGPGEGPREEPLYQEAGAEVEMNGIWG